MLLLLLCALAAGLVPSGHAVVGRTGAWPPSGYQTDPDWKPAAPASLGVTGVSAVACLTPRCPEVYVAQRGGSQPIVVLDSKTGAFVRAFGDNATAGGANVSLFGKIHGLRASQHSPVAGADLWATDAKRSKILGFNAGTGELVTSFGSRGTGTNPQLEFGNVADLAFSRNSSMFVSDGDGGINSRVARLTPISSGGSGSCTVKPGAPPAYRQTCATAGRNKTACDALSMTCRWHATGGKVEWATTWVTGNNASNNNDKYGGNFSSPHSIAYDACWDAVFVADRNHQRVVQLAGGAGPEVGGGEFTPAWDLECLLGYHYDNISDPSSYAVWSVRTANTMGKDHTGKLFVGIVSCRGRRRRPPPPPASSVHMDPIH